MSRKNFAVEKGFDIFAENGALEVSQISGAGAPGGDAGPQYDAPIGSLYQRTNGEIYRKTANAAEAADWNLMDDASDPNNSAQITGVTTITELDSVLVDDVLASEWEVHVFEEATPANVQVLKILATHNGTASADATLVDDTSYGKLRLGSNFNIDLDVSISGAGGAQIMAISATSSTAGVTVTSRRNDIVAP